MMTFFENMIKFLDYIIYEWTYIEDEIDLDRCETMKDYHIPRKEFIFRNSDIIKEKFGGAQ